MTPKARAALVQQAKDHRAAMTNALTVKAGPYAVGYNLGYAHGIERALKAEKGRARRVIG